jgi:hypothetical protein
MNKLAPAIQKFLDSPSEVIKGTRRILEHTFLSNKTQNIGLSLNGGKDSTVILFLSLYFLKQFGKKFKFEGQTPVHLHEGERSFPANSGLSQLPEEQLRHRSL